MRIWKRDEITLDALQLRRKGTMMEFLEIEYTEIGDDFIRAKMPVNEKTKQPMGILHGGAHVVLAESLGSLGANLCLDNTQEYAVGLDINSNHLKSVNNGYVHGIAKPIHIGKQTHVWEIKIYNDAEQLLNISRLTMMVMKIVK